MLHPTFRPRADIITTNLIFATVSTSAVLPNPHALPLQHAQRPLSTKHRVALPRFPALLLNLVVFRKFAFPLQPAPLPRFVLIFPTARPLRVVPFRLPAQIRGDISSLIAPLAVPKMNRVTCTKGTFTNRIYPRCGIRRKKRKPNRK